MSLPLTMMSFQIRGVVNESDGRLILCGFVEEG